MTADHLTPFARAMLDEEVRYERKRRRTQDEEADKGACPPPGEQARRVVRVENPDGSYREFARRPPPDTPFRWRLRTAWMRTSWDLSNGRFIRRPLRHRLPPAPFRSNQHERQDEFRKWLHAAFASRYKGRPLWRRKAPTFWWGSFARMRVPASRGMVELNREFHRMLAEKEDEEC